MLVYPRADEAVGGLRRQEAVVDADAVVLLPGTRLIVPERVDAGTRRGSPDSVCQSESEEAPKLGACLRQEQGVIDPDLRVLGIDRRRNDVEIAGQYHRLL